VKVDLTGLAEKIAERRKAKSGDKYEEMSKELAEAFESKDHARFGAALRNFVKVANSESDDG